jgi:hypothetical protein
MSHRSMTVLVFVLGLLWLATTGFQTIAPALEGPPMTYRNIPFPVYQPVYAGGVISMNIERCNLTDHTFDFDFVRVLHSLDGGMSIIMASDRSIATVGPCLNGIATFQLPPEARPGRYEVIGIVTAPGRFRREFKIPYSSEPFDILPKEARP